MLELLLFGAIEVHRNGASGHGLSAKGKLLLAYLALHPGRAVTSARIAEAVFADSQAEDPHDLVKKTASEIRRFLGTEGRRLTSPAPRTLALDLEGAPVDWAEFRADLRRGDPESLEHAIALHTRPFLEEEPLYWALEEQANCLRLRQQALETLARPALASGDLEGAGQWFAQMLKFELPDVTLNEMLWQEFLAALLQRHEYGKFQLHYGRLQAFLERTAGRGPQEATAALYQRIPKSILLRLSQALQRRPRRILPASARLPHFPLALLGRDSARKELMGAFKNSHLVTIVGIGGVGKTRFAVQVGQEIAADYQDEVGFFDLTACAPNTVLSTLATHLGVKETGVKPLYDSLRDLLAPHRVLLILDNCEHLLAEIATLAADLVRDCPHLRLLLTSREMLRIDGEQVFALDPLALPTAHTKRSPSHTQPLSLSAALESPAVRLFIERATAVRPGFTLTTENAETVTTLCRLVDGLPLGIEMVASQVAGAPLERIAAKLSESALTLRHTRRGISPRHQTMQATLDWSVGLLGEAERILLRRLAVFTGGWTLEAAESICADSALPRAEIASVLSELVTKSLVVMERSEGAAPPFRFLETIRTYAAAESEESGETDRLKAAHCTYYLRMLTEMDDLSRIKTYLAVVERDRSNLLSALQRSLETPGLLETGHQILLRLHTYWAHAELRSEGREWHRKFQHLGLETLPKSALAATMLKIFDYSARLSDGESAEAQECLQQAFALYRELGDRRGESDVYLALGTQQSYRERQDEAYANFQKAVDYYRDAGPPATVVFLLIMMGGCQTGLQQHDLAEESHRQALELARSGSMPSMEGLALLFRGFSARDRGLLELAEQYFTRSHTVYESIPSAWGVVRAQANLAEITRRLGKLDRSLELFRSCLVTAREFSNPQETVYILAALAALLHDRQDWEASLNLSAGLLHLRDLFPDPLQKSHTDLHTPIAVASAHLDPQTTEALLLEARTTDLDALQDYAIAILTEQF
ncbi:MAG: hypothetical protein JWN14_822 [Chthonomonadales bacterium]|nr:hypothetical protein [Chthonomonadales bacterium]